jgi:hypothetical protein
MSGGKKRQFLASYAAWQQIQPFAAAQVLIDLSDTVR